MCYSTMRAGRADRRVRIGKPHIADLHTIPARAKNVKSWTARDAQLELVAFADYRTFIHPVLIPNLAILALCNVRLHAKR